MDNKHEQIDENSHTGLFNMYIVFTRSNSEAWIDTRNHSSVITWISVCKMLHKDNKLVVYKLILQKIWKYQYFMYMI